MTSTASRPAARGGHANGKGKIAQEVIQQLKETTGAGDVEIQLALQDSNGDVNAAASALLDGNRFQEVKKKTRSKPAEKPSSRPPNRDFPRRDNDRRDYDRSASGQGRGRGRGDYDGSRPTGRGRGGRGRGGRGPRDADAANSQANGSTAAPEVMDYGSEAAQATPVPTIPDAADQTQQSVPAPAPMRPVAAVAPGLGGGSWASKLKERPAPPPAPEPEPAPVPEHHAMDSHAEGGWVEPQPESAQQQEHPPVEQHDTFGSGYSAHDGQNGASAWGAPAATAAPQWGSQPELPPARLEDAVAKTYDAPPGMPSSTQPYSTTAPTQRAFDLSSLGDGLKQYGTDGKGYSAAFLPKEPAEQDPPAGFAQTSMPVQEVDFDRYGFQPAPDAQMPSEPETKDAPPPAYMQPAPGFGRQFGNQSQPYGNSYADVEEPQTKQPEPSYARESKPELEQPEPKESTAQDQEKEEEQDVDAQQDAGGMNQYAGLPQDMNSWGVPAMAHPDMYGMQGQRPPAAGQMPAQQGMMPGQPNMQMPGQSQAQMSAGYMPNNPSAMTGFPGGYAPNMANFQMPGYSGYMPPNMANFQMPAYNAYGQYPAFQGQNPYNPTPQAPFHNNPSNFSNKPQYSDNYAHNGAGRGRGRKGKAGRGGGGGNFGQQMGNMPADSFGAVPHGGAPAQYNPNAMNFVDPQAWQNSGARFDNFKEKQGQQGFSGYTGMPYAEQGYGAFSQQYPGYAQPGNWGNPDKSYGKANY